MEVSWYDSASMRSLLRLRTANRAGTVIIKPAAAVASCLVATLFLRDAVGQGGSTSKLATTSAVGDSQALSRLWNVADDALTSDSQLGRTRVSVSGTVLRYDFSPALPGEILSSTDPFCLPLEELIRVLALRRDFGRALPSERFWAQPLDRAYAVVRQAIQKGGVFDVSSSEALADDFKQQIDDLERATNSFAGKHNLDVQGSREPALGYEVQISIQPPINRVLYMPYLEYKKCIVFSAPLDDQWRVFNDGGKYLLIGRYYYKTERSDSSSRLNEGILDVRTATKFAFPSKGQLDAK